jgi:hypothetical protein
MKAALVASRRRSTHTRHGELVRDVVAEILSLSFTREQ